MYGVSHVKDKAVVRPSYFKHGNPYTGKTTSLYRDGPQIALSNDIGFLDLENEKGGSSVYEIGD